MVEYIFVEIIPFDNYFFEQMLMLNLHFYSKYTFWWFLVID